jgi:hypothetical protein
VSHLVKVASLSSSAALTSQKTPRSLVALHVLRMDSHFNLFSFISGFLLQLSIGKVCENNFRVYIYKSVAH